MLPTARHLLRMRIGVIAGEEVSFTTQGSATLAGSNTYDGVTTVGIVDVGNIFLTLRNNMASRFNE